METLTENRNIEIAKKGFADFGDGNIPAILDACTNDVTWGAWNNDAVPYAQTYSGKAGVAEFFKNISETIAYSAFEPKEFYAAGNKVFAKVYHAAMVKATGKSFAHDTLLEFTIEEGLIKSFFAYVDSYDQAKAFAK